ncbi:MAG: DNA-deoxyinosine glycosylase [Ruthenibacterium sp.]
MSFPPIVTPCSRLLILGTWPSPKSREQGFYYGHPQNRFWPLLARLLAAAAPCTIAEKTALIEKNGLALWDVLASCTITGAADASIRDAVPNDIAALCRTAPIRKVLCNGAAAYRLYQRYCGEAGEPVLPAVQMPSTSPANAAWSMDRLYAAWDAAMFDSDL